MTRTRQTIAEARETLIDAARQFVLVRPRAVVVIADDGDETVRAATPTAPPEGLNAYDSAIVAALTENPASSQRLARAAGRRHNSFFRHRRTLLVESGRVRRTKRGYSRA